MLIRNLALKVTGKDSFENPIVSIITTDSDIAYIVRSKSIEMIDYKNGKILNSFSSENMIRDPKLDSFNELICTDIRRKLFIILDAATLQAKTSFKAGIGCPYHFSLNKNIIVAYDTNSGRRTVFSNNELDTELGNNLYDAFGFYHWKFLEKIQENIIAGVSQDNDSLLRVVSFKDNKFHKIITKEFKNESITQIFSLSADKILICSYKIGSNQENQITDNGDFVHILNIKTSEIKTLRHKFDSIPDGVRVTPDYESLIGWRNYSDKNHSELFLFDLTSEKNESFKTTFIKDVSPLANGNLLVLSENQVFEYALYDYRLQKLITDELPCDEKIKAIVGSYLTSGTFNSDHNEKKADNHLVVTSKEQSIYYKFKNAKNLKAIEISDDMSHAKFYCSEVSEKKESCLLHEGVSLISSALEPCLPGIGSTATYASYVEIYGMKAYSRMSELNRNHIDKTISISDQFHPLEWFLMKARDAKLLSNEAYQRIRIDVRNRVKQLEELAKIKQSSFLQMLSAISGKYVPDDKFTRISNLSDCNEFAGQLVAYQSNSFHFSNAEEAITLPVEVAEHKVRFALIKKEVSRWGNFEIGFSMDCFTMTNAVLRAHALVDSQIKNDSILAMRIATVQELIFLKLAIELDQANLENRSKLGTIKILEEKIAQSSGISNSETAMLSQFSLFGAIKNTAMPPFTVFETGLVDWKEQASNKL